MATSSPLEISEAAIFARLWENGKTGLIVGMARHLLKLRFSDGDQARMHELAVKNQSGLLTPSETEELDNFVKVGDLLAFLQSKARQRLKKVARGVTAGG